MRPCSHLGPLLGVAVASLVFGCAERVLGDAEACDVGRAVPVVSFEAQEYPDASNGLRTEAGQVVIVQRYSEDVLELARSLGGAWGPPAYGPEPSSRRASWVERCGDSWALPSEAFRWAEVGPGGPFVAVRSEGAALVRDLREAEIQEPLPGEEASFVGAVGGSILGLAEGGFYAWNPDEPPSDRRVLPAGAVEVVAPTHTDVGDEVFVIDWERSLWAIRVEDGAQELVAKEVLEAYTPDGRYFLVEGGLFGRVGSRLSLVDWELDVELMLSPDGNVAQIDRLASGEVRVVFHEWISPDVGDPPQGSIGTALMMLPGGETMRWSDAWSGASFGESEIYLQGEDGVVRVDRSTGELERVAPFPGTLQFHDDWMYLISSLPAEETVTGHRLHRRPRASADAPWEQVIARSVSWPLMLRDGTWAFLRAQDEREPGELHLWDPQTNAAELLATGVPADVEFRTRVRDAFSRMVVQPNGYTDLAYVTIEPGVGGTLWNYRVPPP